MYIELYLLEDVSKVLTDGVVTADYRYITTYLDKDEEDLTEYDMKLIMGNWLQQNGRSGVILGELGKILLVILKEGFQKAYKYVGRQVQEVSIPDGFRLTLQIIN